MMHMKSLIAGLLLAGLLTAVGCAPTTPPVPSTNPVESHKNPDKGDANVSGMEKNISGFGTSISDGFSAIGKTFSDLIERIQGNTPEKYAKMMESAEPDSRRAGISNIVEHDFARRPPYT